MDLLACYGYGGNIDAYQTHWTLFFFRYRIHAMSDCSIWQTVSALVKTSCGLELVWLIFSKMFCRFACESVSQPVRRRECQLFQSAAPSERTASPQCLIFFQLWHCTLVACHFQASSPVCHVARTSHTFDNPFDLQYVFVGTVTGLVLESASVRSPCD